MRRVCGPAGTSTISKRPSAPENACWFVDWTLTSTAARGAPVRASTTVPVTRPVTGCAANSKGCDKTAARQREISKVVTTIEGSWASRSTVEQKVGQLAVGLHRHDVALAPIPVRVD